MLYDYLIIGGGSAGCHLAYFLSREGHSVALAEKQKIGEGASGAAGAFLSPAIGKNNPIQQLINTSLEFALPFYQNLCPDALTQKGLLRVPKNENDAEKFAEYEPFIPFPFEKKEGGFFFKNAGILDVEPILNKLVKSVDVFENTPIQHITYENEIWRSGNITAKHIIFANGADSIPLELPYISIRPIWGQRVEIQSDTPLKYNHHKKLSVSATRNSSHTISIGATHLRNTRETPITREVSLELIAQAQEDVELTNPQVLHEFGGVRAASPDFLPIAGHLIDSKATLEQFPEISRGRKVPLESLRYFPQAYILNGLGARGFVYGPYCAKALSDLLCHQTPLPNTIELSRLFFRWAKRNKNQALTE